MPTDDESSEEASVPVRLAKLGVAMLPLAVVLIVTLVLIALGGLRLLGRYFDSWTW